MDCEREELIEILSKLVKCDPAILRDFPIGLPNLVHCVALNLTKMTWRQHRM